MQVGMKTPLAFAVLLSALASVAFAADALRWPATSDMYADTPALHTPGIHTTNGVVFSVVHLPSEEGEKARRQLEGRAMLQTFAQIRVAYPGLSAKVSLRRQVLENAHIEGTFRYAVAFSEEELATKSKAGLDELAEKEREKASPPKMPPAEIQQREETNAPAIPIVQSMGSGVSATNTLPETAKPAAPITRNPVFRQTEAGLAIEDDQTSLLGD